MQVLRQATIDLLDAVLAERLPTSIPELLRLALERHHASLRAERKAADADRKQAKAASKAEEEAHRVVFDEAHWAMQRKADACTGSGEEELLSKCGVKHNEGNDFSSGLTLTHTLNH